MTAKENIQNDIEAFKAAVLEMEQFLTGTRISYQFFKDKFPEIRNEFTLKPRNDDEIEGVNSFESLNKSIPKFEKDIAKYCFINLIARTEAFLNDIGQSIYLWRLPNLTEEARGKCIEKYSRLSFKNKIKHLSDKFEITFPEIEQKEAEIVELFSRRNIILHNNSLVNQTYLSLNQNSALVAGEEISIEDIYLKLAIVIIVIIAKSIQARIV